MVKTTIIAGLLYMVLAIFQPVIAIQNEGGRSARLGLQTSGPASLSNSKTTPNYALKKQVIKKVLAQYNSPMVDSADAFIQACETYQFDCYWLPSIAGVESYFGQQILAGSYNPFGWGRGLILFKNWDESIDTVGKGLRENYINKGAENLDQIGAIYCEGNTWAGKVRFFHRKFMEEEQKQQLYFSSNTVEL